MVFVTGGTGLLGAYLIRSLVDSGKKVRALKRATSDLKPLGSYADKVEWIEGDILDTYVLEDCLEGISQVYHCAAIVSFDPAKTEIQFRTNVTGTGNVVNACLGKEGIRLLHVSSIAALGRNMKSKLINERSKWIDDKLNSQYAISKFLAENEVWRGVEEGLDCVIVNPAVILGAWNWNDGPTALFRMVWEGLRYYTTGVNGYVDVRDVARCMIMLMDEDVSSERYILSGENLSYKQVFDEIAKGFGKKAPSVKVGKTFAQVAWRLEWIRSSLMFKRPAITRETARITQGEFRYENQKVLDLLDFRFTPINETIKSCCEQFITSRPQPSLLP